jgi:CspA family cold shock protein
VEEQRRQAELGFEVDVPTECPDCRAAEDIEPGLREGVIKWYRDDKHFGFIVQRDGSEVFFHRSNFLGEEPGETLKEGTSVWYELAVSDRGPMATDVHLKE